MSVVGAAPQLDPARYEIFRHRLFHILEEGRVAIKMVSGSPVVVEGGETMCALYLDDGTSILVASGILLHATGGEDFIRKVHEWGYTEDPGLEEGDQLLFNDPYIGGLHLPDMVILKPIYWQGQRIAWAGSIMHTPEVGGLAPGGQPVHATSIFQEGIKIWGLKVVERGKLRRDVFNSLIYQTRDPNLVALDTKAKIAANNVVARRYLELVVNFGLDFVTTASRRIVAESEQQARAKLSRLPEGTWRARLYSDTDGVRTAPFKVQCEMTKRGDALTFDFTGTSPQVPGAANCTLTATWGSLFAAFCGQLFPDVPWNGGMAKPIRVVVPQGTVLNCRYPAACSNGVIKAGQMATTVASACIARLLAAAGLYGEINASWPAIANPGPAFAGQTRRGTNFVGTILDGFAGGCGAAPYRDGVDTGGNYMNPSSQVSDVEIMEQNLPVMYLARQQGTDSGGFGRWRGGNTAELVYMAYGVEQGELHLGGGGGRVAAGFGLMGGYPPGIQDAIHVQGVAAAVQGRFAQSQSVITRDNVLSLGGTRVDGADCKGEPWSDYDLVYIRKGAGGGFGDPLLREPERVALDVRRLAISRAAAEQVYGVALTADGQVDTAATAARRARLRTERLGRPPLFPWPPDTGQSLASTVPVGQGWQVHASLEVVPGAEAGPVFRCRHCSFVFGPTTENYKLRAVCHQRTREEYPRRHPWHSRATFTQYQEYYCPGCGTLLEVDLICPELETAASRILWDMCPISRA